MASLDLIKQYLVGIGFSVDDNSLKNAQASMDQADESIKKFNEDSNKGFSETSGSLKDLFKLLNSSPTLIKAISLAGPFKGLIKDITLAKKMYSEFQESANKKEKSNKDDSKKSSKTSYKAKMPESSSNVKTKVKQKSEFTTDTREKSPQKPKIKFENILNNPKVAKKKVTEFATNTINGLKSIKTVSEGLLNKGGKAIKTFASTGVGALTLIVGATAITIAAIKKVASYLGDLADQDIGYEKLSRQLWTTKENAKEIDMSLKTLGASMQDLWLSPTLLKQFNQLRQDAKNLKLPSEFNQNLKTVQGIGLEFKRLKQMIGLLFQWIGNYILKYCSGPLKSLKNDLHGFNDWLVQNIPNIAKVIGTVLGVLLKLLSILGSILGFAIKVISIPIKLITKLISLIKTGFDKIPEPIKKIAKIIMLLASPILLIIGLIDDLITYFRGGKSVIGGFIDKVTKKSETAGKAIKGILTVIKALLTGGLSLLPWDRYWNKAKEIFEKIRDKAKETWAKVKEWSSGKMEKIKDFVNGTKEKVESFGDSVVNNITPSYVTSNNSRVSNNTNTSNSNNTISNANTINVYGSGDSKSTAKAVSNVLTGISTRNVQGVIN